MAFRLAQRNNLFVKCALYGPSGSGKTMSALRIAQGISMRTNERIAVIDSEYRSASKYADRFVFDVDDLSDKRVESYLASITECQRQGYHILVIDSLSHAWRELTDEVDRITQSSPSRNSFSAWAKVSQKQKQLIEAILTFPGHIIATMRSKTEWVISENAQGRLCPQKMGLAPEQGKGIEYEFDLLLELSQQHIATVAKDRSGHFQDMLIDKPDEHFGIALYDWLNGSAEMERVDNGALSQEKSYEKEGNEIISRIGKILTEKRGRKALFSESEKDDMRKLLMTIRLTQEGIAQLREIEKQLIVQRDTRRSQAA